MGLFSAITNLAGSFLGSRSADKAKDANYEMNEKNIQLQKDFAQQGIRWKVADAKEAGIHPLYALGANTMSFTPSSFQVEPDYSMANGLSRIGQNVSRAIESRMTSEERERNDLTKENMKLQNDMLRAQIGNEVAKQPSIPALPSGRVIPGQGDSSLELPAPKPSYSYVKNRDGSLDVVPSQDFTDRNQNLVSGIMPEIKWFLRNQVLPMFDDIKASLPGRGYPLERVNGKLYYRRGSSLIPYKER